MYIPKEKKKKKKKKKKTKVPNNMFLLKIYNLLF